MVFILFGGTRFYVTTMGNLWNGNIDGIYTFASANGFSLVCIFSWCFRMSCRTSCRQRDFLLCVSSHDISGRSNLQRSRCTSHIQMVFLLCTFLMTFLVCPIDKGIIAYPAGFSPVCTFTRHSRISRHTSCRHRAFLLCLSFPDISGQSDWKMSRYTYHIHMVFLLCTFSHDVSGRSDWQRSCCTSCRLFSCVSHYLTFQNFSSHILQTKGFSPAMCIFFLTFQNVLWHILQEKGFSAMCTFAKYFKMSNCNSCRHRAFLLCVSSHDVSKCLVAHPASIELFSSIIWLEVPKQFGNFITLYISNVFNCVWSLSRNGFQTTGQLNSFKQLFFCFYLLMILQNVSSHILQAKGFYPVYLRMKFQVVPINKGLVQRCSIISWVISIGLTLVYLSLSPSL